MGGTFDPIHIAHLITAEFVYSALGLDEIWFMPTYIPPHKRDQAITASEHRLQMLQLATRAYPEFKICSYELEQNQVSYTFNTMTYMLKKYPEHQFYFIIGGDMLKQLNSWYRSEELLQLVPFIAVNRPNYDLDQDDPIRKLVNTIDIPPLMISSTEIRSRCHKGQSIRFLVPDPVLKYIKEQQLYVE